MRNIFFIVLTLMGSISMQTVAQSFETATEAVKNMRIGWNLGNTLESNSGDTLNMWIDIGLTEAHQSMRQRGDSLLLIQRFS